MTAERLKQYRHLREEIKELSEEIHKLESADIVQGSDNEFPYIKHNMKVIGAGECIRTLEMLKKNLRRIKAEYHALNKFINDISDSELRRIFRYRYIDGWTFQKIAFKVGNGDEQVPRKKHNNFLKKYEKYENAVL